MAAGCVATIDHPIEATQDRDMAGLSSQVHSHCHQCSVTGSEIVPESRRL